MIPDPLPYPALVATHAGLWRADETGQCGAISRAEALRWLGDTPHLLLSAPHVAQRLGLAEVSGLDLLELFAFVVPATFLVPSAGGLADWLAMERPDSAADEPDFLRHAAARLIDCMADPAWPARAGAAESLGRLRRRGWPWAAIIAGRLAARESETGESGARETGQRGSARLSAGLFDHLPEWEEPAPRPAPHAAVLRKADVDAQLGRLAGAERPPRPGQLAYAEAALAAFQPRVSRDGPNLVAAVAGTGIGKTLGYLAPASLYADATGGQVWLSTYTRALQRQLRAECQRSLPDAVASGRIIVRKGRENYLCLLNLEDAMQGGFAGRHAQFAELVARWARYTADGDMAGGDLPGWLPGLFRRGTALPALTDRRGDCIRAACPHFRRCFIEAGIRAGEQADLVIANHALVMVNATRPPPPGRDDGDDADDANRETGVSRMVFDEGHHLLAAADSAFALALTGGEAIELRRWILGPDRGGRRAGRRRGLAARLLDVASYDEAGGKALDAVVEAAQALPASGWLGRIDGVPGEAGFGDGSGGQGPHGPVEELLAAVRAQILLRASDEERGYTLETAIADLSPALLEAVATAAAALAALRRAMAQLVQRLHALVREQPGWIDQPGLSRLVAAADGLHLRIDLLAAWLRLLARVQGEAEADFVDWLALTRVEGRELDCGICRHWIDPAKPLAEAVLAPAHGVLVTSATLGDPPEAAAGADHLPVPAHVFEAASPFDYARAARVFIVTDVQNRDMASLALAYHRLIEAAGGGTLGLFTAISRLRAVHARLADRMARAGLPLYAQHVDPVDTGTLVDLFRADPRASLFGTDALRDGVDVPGDSLRLIVFEGVPWSRPTILNAARRAAFGGPAYEDTQVIHRLQQAFGRLIRSADDRGAFVLLGSRTPSRLLSAFPPNVPVARLPLGEVADAVRCFLAGDCAKPSGFLTGEAVTMPERE